MKPSVSRTFLFVALPVALVLVALIFGGMEVWSLLKSSPKFAVREIEVVTEGVANKEMILRRAAIQPGTNIFSIDLEEVRRRVEQEPWVHSATVVRAIPNKIQIHYKAQVPRAILGAESMYYLNREGVPFYRVQKGDSLAFPLVQVEVESKNRLKDKEGLRQKVEAALGILDRLQASPAFSDKDFGDMTVRLDAEDGAAPYIVSLRFPPKNLVKKGGQSNRLYSVSFGSDSPDQQVKRWEVVVRHLVQQGKNPRLIRLELGKKVVVKVDR